MPKDWAWRNAARVSAVSPRLADGDHQAARVGHAGAVAVFAGHFHLGGDAGDFLEPVFGRAAAVVTGAAGQDEHAVDLFENAPCRCAGLAVQAGTVKQFGHDAFDACERVGNGAWLLEDFFLHVVAIGAQLCRTAVGLHGAHGTLRRGEAFAPLANNPVTASLQVYQVAFFEVNNLVSDARQGHGVAGQKVLGAILSHAQYQWRTRPRTHHALGFVLVHHGDGVGATQFGHSGTHRVEKIAVVVTVHQVRNDFGVGLAGKHIAARLQRGAQLFVVFDDAVVHHRHAPGRAGRCICAGAMAEMGVRVGHGRRAVRGPAGVRDAGGAFKVVGLHLLQQLGHTGRAARAPQPRRRRCIQAGRMHRHATRVIAAVLQPLQALDKDGNDVAR